MGRLAMPIAVSTNIMAKNATTYNTEATRPASINPQPNLNPSPTVKLSFSALEKKPQDGALQVKKLD